MLLETGLGGHAFKIGLGKAFGMGAVESKINKVWIRSNQDYIAFLFHLCKIKVIFF